MRMPAFEKLNFRLLLAGDLESADVADADIEFGPQAAEMAPQFAIKHPPRLQLGNAPLVGTPAFDGFDQIDLIWQTISAGDGTDDSFAVEYRKVGNQEWLPTESLNEPIDTNIGRIMHSVTIRQLEWSTDYQYRVHHLRAGEIIETFQNQFRTRLRAGDQSAFSFAAYGDSTNRGRIENFNSVQARIDSQNVDFSVLLGDNF